jgi:hypothetical protein
MSDNLLSGTAGSVVIGGTVVGEMSEWSFDISHSPVETTAFGEDWARLLGSLQNATGSFSGNFDSADNGQDVLLAAFSDGTGIRVGLWLDATTRLEAQALLTGSEEGVTVDGQDTTLWDFMATGQITYELPRLWLLEDAGMLLWEDDTQAYLTL